MRHSAITDDAIDQMARDICVYLGLDPVMSLTRPREDFLTDEEHAHRASWYGQPVPVYPVKMNTDGSLYAAAPIPDMVSEPQWKLFRRQAARAMATQVAMARFLMAAP